MDFSVGGITIMKSPEGACVELIEAPQFEVGLYSVGTDVDDLDETIEYLKKNGCQPIGEIDPNGVRICLIEHMQEYREKYM